jgi:hypothetical protein
VLVKVVVEDEVDQNTFLACGQIELRELALPCGLFRSSASIADTLRFRTHDVRALMSGPCPDHQDSVTGCVSSQRVVSAADRIEIDAIIGVATVPNLTPRRG